MTQYTVAVKINPDAKENTHVFSDAVANKKNYSLMESDDCREVTSNAVSMLEKYIYEGYFPIERFTITIQIDTVFSWNNKLIKGLERLLEETTYLLPRKIYAERDSLTLENYCITCDTLSLLLLIFQSCPECIQEGKYYIVKRLTELAYKYGEKVYMLSAFYLEYFFGKEFKYIHEVTTGPATHVLFFMNDSTYYIDGIKTDEKIKKFNNKYGVKFHA